MAAGEGMDMDACVVTIRYYYLSIRYLLLYICHISDSSSFEPNRTEPGGGATVTASQSDSR